MSLQRLHPILLLIITLLLISTRSYWPNTSIEYLLCVLCIFITGIPHGSMDHHTASFLNGGRFRLLQYLIQYVAAAGAYLILWFLMPGFAFILFLLLTAWHFGETDIHTLSNKKMNGLLLFIYGFSLTMWLLLKDPAIILYWTGIITNQLEWVQLLMKWLLRFPHWGWFMIAAAVLIFSIHSQPGKWLDTGLFLTFVWLSPFTSLLVGFVIYFSGWHSVQALKHLRISVFKAAGLQQMLWSAIPAITGALLILAAIFFLGNSSWINHNGLPALFILLAVLTLPHLIQMHRLYRYFSSEKMNDAKEGE